MKFTLLLLALGASEGALPGPLTLKYFDARGAAEVARVLFAIGGQEYVDHRYKMGPGFEAPEFKADKDSGALGRNLGRAPLLLTPEGEIGQSKAIERYVAAAAGLMGNTPFEAATIDMLVEHVRDVRDAQRTKGFSAMTRGKTDEEKAALRTEWYGSDLPGWLGRIEACVVAIAGGEGASHSVGGALSYADVCIWALLREVPAADAADLERASAACKTLNCIADTVAAHPKVAAWVQARPKTAF